MKDLNLLVWLTQLGLGVALPLAGFIYLAVWLRGAYDLGSWVVLCGVALGLIAAVGSLRSSLQAMERMSRPAKKAAPDPVSFNDHD